jgi:hypothetical protein
MAGWHFFGCKGYNSFKAIYITQQVLVAAASAHDEFSF